MSGIFDVRCFKEKDGTIVFLSALKFEYDAMVLLDAIKNISFDEYLNSRLMENGGDLQRATKRDMVSVTIRRKYPEGETVDVMYLSEIIGEKGKEIAENISQIDWRSGIREIVVDMQTMRIIQTSGVVYGEGAFTHYYK